MSNRTSRKILLYLIAVIFMLCLSIITLCTFTQSAYASAKIPLENSIYWLSGTWSRIDAGKDVFPSSSSDYTYGATTPEWPLHRWVKIGISNGESSTHDDSDLDSEGPYRARRLTFTLQGRSSGKGDTQHLYSATLYKDDKEYKTCGASPNLKGEQKFTMFDISNPESGTYQLELKYSVDKGWQVPVWGVSWVGYKYKSIKFKIDNSAPEYITKPTDDAIVRSAAILTNYANGHSIYVDGENTGKYVYSITAEGKHSYYLCDDQGNKTGTSYVYIDKTAPTGSLSGVSHNGITSGAVYFSQSTESTKTGSTAKSCDHDTITLKYRRNSGTWQTYTNRSVISDEGKYDILISDTAGNSNTYSFEIDKTAPSGTLNGVSNGGITNNNVSFTWSDSRATATLDGSSYTKGATISSEGTHTIKLTDSAGNYRTYTFEIDKTPTLPSIYTEGGTSLVDGAIINQSFYFTWRDSRTTAQYRVNGGAWQEYWQAYYQDRRNPSVKYTDQVSALRAIMLVEISNTVETTWNGSGTVFPNDIQQAQIGKSCWLYENYVFFQQNSLNTYRANKVNSYLENVTRNLFTSSGIYEIKLTDTANNIITRTITIDKTAPTGTLTGVTNGGMTNNNVSFTWSEDGATATLNGAMYPKGSVISNEGIYTITLKDRAGNSTLYTFEIDRTAPIGQLNGLTNTVYNLSNNSVSFNWNESSASATLNGAPYTKGTAIATEGRYTIVLTDRAGNSTTYSFEIDKTAPQGKLIGLTNDEYKLSNNNVRFTWSEDGATATLNGKAYANNQEIANEGFYTIILTDRAGNSTSYSFEIDKTAPTGTFTGLSNKEYCLSNGIASFRWSENGATATINGKAYLAGTDISDEGVYTFVLTDRAGNSNTYTLGIDTTAPTGQLAGLTNSEYKLSNGPVSFTWTETTATARISHNNGAFNQFHTGTVITSAGRYIIELSDRAGNLTSYNFEIDLTAPQGQLSGITNIRYNLSNSKVRFIWDDTNATATLNDETYLSGEEVTSEGKHTIILSDRAGNSTSYSFEIDLTSPIGTLTGVTNGGITNTDVFFAWNEEGATASVNNKQFLSGSGIESEGSHVIILKDLAGNTTTYNFTIDKTGPTGQLSGLTNLDYNLSNKSVRFDWSETTATATLNGATYIKNTTINIEGVYKIILTDRAGNSTLYTFEIDLTAPTGALAGVNDSGVTNDSVIFAWSEDGATATLDRRAYNSGEIISSEGSHVIVLTDRAGNSTSYTFEIDKTAPTGQLSGVTDGGVTKDPVTFAWSEPASVATINGSIYTKNTAITAEGFYKIVLTDRAGNSSTYSFEIDKSPAVGYFNLSGNNISNVYYFNQDVYFLWDELDAYAEISINTGSYYTYQKSTLLKSEGEYCIKLYDRVGNLSLYNFVIDKTPYTQNKNYIMKEYVCHINKWYESYSYKLQDNKYVENVMYSFTNYDDTLRFAINRERDMIEMHNEYLGGNIFCNYANDYVSGTDVSSTASMTGQPYYIYKSIDNPSKLIAYFKESNLEAAINKYAERSISLKYLPNTPAVPYPGDSYIGEQQIYRDQIYIKDTSFTLPYKQAGGYLYINGNSADYSQVLNTGLNVIKEVDYAGNETVYTIILDTSAPQILCEDAVGNVLSEYEDLLNSERTEFYFDKEMKLSLLDNYDENALLTISFDGITNNVIGNKFELNKSGVYSFTIRDIAGNTKNGTIYLSLDPPSISITENLSVTSRLESFDVLITKNLSFNRITSINVQRRDLEGGEYINVTVDDFGSAIKNTTLNYRFVSNGDYIITIIDNYYREIKYEYSFAKEAPIGTLYTRNGGILKNGSITNQDVYFSWADKTCIAYYILESDGTEIEYPIKEYITSSGKYTILLRDAGGNTSKYVFEIDKTPPASGKVYYIDEESGREVLVPNKTKTNHTVFFAYDTAAEQYAVVRYTIGNTDKWILYSGEGLTLDGSYIFQLTDQAGNSTNYQFSIDTTPPVVTIKTSSNQLLNNNSVTNKSVRFVFDEPNVIAKLNKENYTSGTLIREEGTYSLYIEDSCSNFATYFVTIDLTAPTGELSGVTNGGITNTNVVLSWAENNLSLYLNGVLSDNNDLSSKSITVSDEGKYNLELRDPAGNSTLFSFEIDKTAPIGTLTGVTNGGITNRVVAFNWDNSTYSATLNGEVYLSNTNIRAEGIYTLVLIDRAGNSTTYTFEIDLTAPIGVLSGVTNGGITNTDVFFTWDEEGVTVRLNSIVYNKNQKIFAEGKYKLVITDRAGNLTTYNFEIDKSSPVGILTGVTNGGITNTNVSFTWDNSTYSATLNGQLYNSGTIIRNEGLYTIVLTDRAGNSSTYNFEIDKTGPIGQLNGLTNSDNKLSNSFVFLTWTEDNLTATINGSIYSNNTKITEEGSYEILLTDLAGNTTSFVFVIDKTAPQGQLNNLTNNNLSNKTVTFTWNELSASATLNGTPYTNGNYISNEGSYIIILKDLAGNTTTYNFVIDKTAPDGVITGLTNPEYKLSNGPVSFTWEETGCYALLNSERIDNNFIVSAEGNHVIVLIDPAGNSTTYTFEIDLTAPQGQLTGLTDNVYNLSNKTVAFVWEESTATATLNGASYLKNSKIIDEGNYTIVLTDRAGNSTSYSFEIDKTAPIFFVYDESENPVEGNYFNNSISISWNENFVTATLNNENYIQKTIISLNGPYEFKLTDRAGNSSVFAFTIKKTTPTGYFQEKYNLFEGIYYFNNTASFTWDDSTVIATLNGNPYTNKSIIRAEGKYTLVLTDIAGNSSSFDFIIDKTAPTGHLSGLSNESLRLTNKPVSLTWDEENVSATINGELYNGQQIVNEGKYVIILTDISGNSTTYTFEIDLTAPIGILVGVNDKGISNSSVKITWEESYITVTLNGKEINNNYVAATNGVYSLILTDRAGNSNTYSFEIDKSIPSGTLYGVKNNGITNTDVFFEWLDPNYSATINGENYQSKDIISADGIYEIILTGKSGNTSVYSFEIDKTAPDGIITGLTNTDYNLSNGTVMFTWDDTNATATLNGKYYEKGNVITSQGKYILVLTDRAENSTSYNFEIDKTAPTGELIGLSNVELSLSNNVISFITNEDYQSLTINGQDYLPGTNISDEGRYTIVLTDRAGNSTTYTFEIDLTAPTGELVGLIADSVSNDTVTFTWEELNCFVVVNDITYYNQFTTSTEGIYFLRLFDQAGNYTSYSFEIDKTPSEGRFEGLTNPNLFLSNGPVSFNWIDTNDSATLNGEVYENGSLIQTEGKYVLILTDIALNQAIYEFEIDMTAPSGQLNGITNLDYQLSNDSVIFEWNEKGATATLNGEIYNGAAIKDEGKYVVVLTDLAGNSTSYTFEIDKTAPTGTFSGFTNELYNLSNKDVSFMWDEDGVTALLNEEFYESGVKVTSEGKHTIILIDRAGNRRVYEFEIDLTAPTANITDNLITNKNVKIEWDENYLTATLKFNDEELKPYKNGENIRADGKYIFELTDRAGNTTIYRFEINRTPPIADFITSDGEKNTMEEGKYTNISQGFYIPEGPYTITVNNEEYLAGTIISEVGRYEIVIINAVGNRLNFAIRIIETPVESSSNNIAINIILYVILGIALVLLIIKLIISKTKRKQKLTH